MSHAIKNPSESPEIKQPGGPRPADLEDIKDEPEIHIPDDEQPEIGEASEEFPNQ
jgi:hypothetical protein